MTFKGIVKTEKLSNAKKYSIPFRSVDVRNGLKEEVNEAKNVRQVKEKTGQVQIETTQV